MTRLMVTILCAAAAAFSAAPAMAAEQCAARADMIKALGEKFRENPTALGVVNRNVIVEVFVSDQGTWTILASDTRGQSCVISVGEGWESAVTTAALPGT
ncbi:MAG: hypothetical protein EOS85_30865 [Mesorhizobium sp.]|uniref:hypothetical protein n=1 Tax=Mesorhizobium sp. TaxID=1871066 RepID=UPI000FD55C60|nr:hypothetical protein [Mesorhizobium sp.]RUU11500.1 hypothetical protein EOD08_31970 [Mesorhizobium sp. M6A.T.Ca.TU.002.02.2.1]RWP00371.1 MAG: hypothetical protein EOQ98_10750 [Mesorhizobium sp.]RWP76694.1 MAG: hypothetical protein EOR09_10145 [Mesorhizobium sp.]RWQ43405.1 MAG: hypothetical protein EOS21_04990 [Mesorhizobium sp.]RWQ69004.1 MAG: hypothetical protein EOS85_30865 [Mesorhizobium sp.]